VIYNLNGEVHWELSRDLMSAMVSIVDGELQENREAPRDTQWPDKMVAELLNFRNTLQSELDKTAADNTDLI
jgi:hypothetical protein